MENRLDDIISVYGNVVSEFIEMVSTESPKHIIHLQADLVLKSTRFIANLALEQTIGDRMKDMAELEELIELLPLISDHEELELNAIGCLANLSFYMKPNSRLFDCSMKAFSSKRAWKIMY